MTTEFKIGQKFSVIGLENVMTITNITEKGKVYYSAGNARLANKNVMTKASKTNKDLQRYIEIGHWTLINK
jgi:hypothetical protein